MMSGVAFIAHLIPIGPINTKLFLMEINMVSYIGVSLHTQDLLQQRGDAGENSDARTEAQQQDEVGFVPQ